MPERFGACVEATVPQQERVTGTSSMLGAAAGFVAARALDPAKLRPLVATGTLAWPSGPSGTGGPIGGRVGIRPVAGIARKLYAVSTARQPGGLLVALPEADHEDDAADTRAIEGAIAALEARGDTVLRASWLDQVFKAWVPPDAWATPELAADYAGVGRIKRPPRPIPWLFAGGTAAALLAALLYILDPNVVAERILADPDARCDRDTRLIDSGQPGQQQAAAAACRALEACDDAAGHPLDPDRRARGRSGGIGLDFLAQPPRTTAARQACEAAVHLAANSSKAPWHLSRVREAQGDIADATALRERAARGGEPMSRLRLAQDSLTNGDAAAARDQIRLLTERREPVPEAVYWYAWLLGCGVGAPRDGPAGAALGRRLIDLADSYRDASDFVHKARRLADGLAASAAPEPPTWCNAFHP